MSNQIETILKEYDVKIKDAKAEYERLDIEIRALSKILGNARFDSSNYQKLVRDKAVERACIRCYQEAKSKIESIKLS